MEGIGGGMRTANGREKRGRYMRKREKQGGQRNGRRGKWKRGEERRKGGRGKGVGPTRRTEKERKGLILRGKNTGENANLTKF